MGHNRIIHKLKSYNKMRIIKTIILTYKFRRTGRMVSGFWVAMKVAAKMMRKRLKE